MYKNHFVCCLLVWWSFLSLYGQHSQLRSYTLDDGLPQSQVYDIVQDQTGYLWIGTQGGGLCRFDGDKFEIWNEKKGLLSNYIHTLSYVDDRLFIGTKRGLSIMTKKGFRNLESPQINIIYHMEGVLYLGTNTGIFTYRKGDDHLKKIKLHKEINTSIVNDIIFDGDLFWIATNKGLWKVDFLVNAPSLLEKHETNDFKSLVCYKDKIFAATYDDGILVIDDASKGSADLLIREPLRVNQIAIVNKNQLWVATDYEGITIIDPETYNETNKLDRKSGLKVTNIRRIITDRQANNWIATSGGGFYKYFRNNFTHYDEDTGLKGNRVYAIHAAKDGIWVSNSEAGLVKIDTLGIHHIPQVDHFSEVKIKTITSDQNNNIWAGTDGRGMLFRETKQLREILKDSVLIDSLEGYRVQTDTLIKTITENHIIDTDKGLLSDWIRTVVIGDSNVIWAATYSDGITKFAYNSQKDSLAVLKNFGKKEGVEDVAIRDMKKDSLGTVWYATQKGHLGYIQNNKVTHLGNVLQQKVAINTLLFHKNKLYLGTAGRGIWWSDSENPISFKKLEGQKHPYSENIYQLIFDDQGYLWAGTERGVDKMALSPSNEILDAFHFGKNEGFLGIETCLNAVAKDNAGSLWFGAIYGLTKYYPRVTTTIASTPKLRFEDIQVGYKSLDSIDFGEWTNSKKVLQLRPEQTQMTFAYSTVDIDHPNAIQYRFKLDKEAWSPWNSDSKQNLPGLRYGAHSFTAQSRNYRWEESEPISFHFFIDSPLYEKAWFQWVVLALVTVIILLLAWLYIRGVKRRNKKEKEHLQLQNHLLSLEHKALRLQMNPHFIFNVLNGIKAMGTSNPEKMNTTINTFATLLRETLHNSRKDEITLDQEIKTLRNYIEVEKLMTSTTFTYEISTNLDLEPEEILIPPMLIQPFVENAIRHGILKGNKDGALKIAFHSEGAYLYCHVIDNGIGIFESQKTKTKTDHQSMALTVTRERLESISGKNALNIMEIKNNDQTVSGTQVVFKIPLLTDY